MIVLSIIKSTLILSLVYLPAYAFAEDSITKMPPVFNQQLASNTDQSKKQVAADKKPNQKPKPPRDLIQAKPFPITQETVQPPIQPTKTSPLEKLQASNEPHSKELVVKTDKVYDPNILSVDSIQAYEAKFNFDWNNYTTIASNRKKIEEIQAFLNTNPDFTKLNSIEQQSLGRMLYKLATFYAHIDKQPDLAIEMMTVADKYLKSKQDRAWNYNNLAFAYEQRFFKTGKEADDKKGFYYSNKVIYDLYHQMRSKEVAFAYCVQGVLRNDEKNYGLAENSFKTALNIYEKIPGGKDDQYMRAKNRLASVILAMGRELEAINMFEDIKKYWFSKPDYTQNPYAARNLVSLGQAYFKIGDYAKGAEQIENSIGIYQNVYGKKHEILVKPFKLLSEAYKELNNDRLSTACQSKANESAATNSSANQAATTNNKKNTQS